MDLPEFQQIAKLESDPSVVKPVVIITVDGGPDENPRYKKVIDVAAHHFLSRNLDAMFIATNGINLISVSPLFKS